VESYAEGKIPQPSDAKSAEDWKFNDNYAQVIIMNNITSTEMVHVSQCMTAKAMWDSLEAVHESKGHQTIVSIIRNLFHTRADEESNITEHLNQLKQYWERINQIDEDDFKCFIQSHHFLITSAILGYVYGILRRRPERRNRNGSEEVDGISTVYQNS